MAVAIIVHVQHFPCLEPGIVALAHGLVFHSQSQTYFAPNSGILQMLVLLAPKLIVTCLLQNADPETLASEMQQSPPLAGWCSTLPGSHYD
jgi:hypothetical protein